MADGELTFFASTMKVARLLFVSGSLVLLTMAMACVGGPGQLPDDQGQTQQQGGTGNSTQTSPPSSGGGAGGSTGSGTVNPGGSSGSSGSSGTNIKRSIATNEFNQNCSGESPTECIALFFGGTCTACQCPNAAINASESEKYKKLMSERSDGCAIPDIACAPCKSVTAICVANTCQITTASSPDAG
jgi:hypothetical protein